MKKKFAARSSAVILPLPFVAPAFFMAQAAGRWLGALVLAVFLSGFSHTAFAAGPNFNDTDNKAVTSLNPSFSGTITLPGGVWSSAGNLGIGSVSPQQKLDVEGTVYVGSNGNIGIGTTSPRAGLQIGSGASALGSTLNGTGALIRGNLEVDGKIYGDGSSLTGVLSIGGMTQNYVTKMGAAALTDSQIFDNGANIGIGTDQPGAALQVGTGASALGVSLGGTGVLVRGNLEVDGVLYGNGSGLTGISGVTQWSGTTGAPIYYNLANVGIGAAVPRAKLDVEGTVYVGSSGNIGIGTSSPRAGLQVGSGAASLSATLTGTAALIKGNLEVDGKIYGDGSNLTGLPVVSQWSGTTGAPIYYNLANVGIGSSSPQAKLDVEGSVYFGSGNIGVGDASPDSLLDMLSSAASNTYIKMTNTNAGDYDAAVQFELAEGTPSFTIGVDDSDADKFKISTTALGTNDRLVITSAGNVGIGSSSPQEKLDVEGTVYFGSGNVGVGDASPDSLLDLLSSAAANTYLKMTNTNAGDYDAAVQFELAEGTPSFTIGVDDSDADKFKISTTALGTSDRLVITSTGNVGIGSSSPQAKLDVEGGVYVGSGGNIGIGTSSPATGLQVGSGASALGVSLNGSGALIRGNLEVDGKIYGDGSGITNIVSSQWSGTPGSPIYYNAANVGIGSSSPQAKLDVEGTVYFGSGNVGVGDASPNSLLDLLSGTAADTYIKMTNTNAGDYDAAVQFELAEGTPSFTIGVDDSDADKFKISTTALGTNDRLVIDSTGNVGVGDASPDSFLDLLSSTANNTYIKMTNTNAGDYDAAVQFELAEGTPSFTIGVDDSDADKFKISTTALGTNDRLVIDANGNLGVSDASPDSLLDLLSAAAADTYIKMTNTNAGDYDAAVQFELAEGTPSFTIGVDDSDADKFKISTTALGTNDRFVITSTGNVGISSSSPQQRLDVEGTVYFGSGNVGVGDATPDSLLDMLSAAAANTYLKMTNTNAGDYDAAVQFELAEGTPTFTVGVDDSDADKFKISTTALGTNDRLVITSNGNVGIGSASPGAKLVVDGGVYIWNGSGTVNYARNAGDLYVHNTLEVDGNVYLGDAITDNLTVAGSLSLAGDTSYTGPVSISTTDVNAFKVTNTGGGTTYFNVDTSTGSGISYFAGNVGINTVTPRGNLEVTRSPASVPPLLVSSAVTKNGDYLVVTSAGNVGISSSAPQQKLDVEGTVYFGTGNVGVGIALPTSRLHVSPGDGDIRLGDITAGTASTDSGIMLNGTGVYESAMFTEVNGEVLSYGINVPQITTRNTARVGGIFRLDARSAASFPDGGAFIVFGYAEGSSSEVNRFAVNLNNGNTLLSPAAGNVGVGDTSPDSLLDLLSSTAADTYIKMTNTNAGDYDTAVQFELVEGTPTFTVGVDDSDADKFKISTTALGTNDRLVIDSTGNVGLGDASPDSFLDLLSSTANNTYIKMTNTNAGDYDAAVQFELAEGTPSFTIGVDDSDGDKFKISTTALGTNDRLVIDSTGNVGVGDASPDSLLDMLSSAAANTYIKMTNTNAGDYDAAVQFELAEGTPSFTIGVDDSDGDKFKISTTALGTNDRLVIDANGNVGLGDSTPLTRLVVGADTTATYVDGTNGDAYVQDELEVDGVSYLADLIVSGSAAVPSGAAPTVDAAGEVAVDTTDDQLVYYGAAKRVLPYKQFKSFTIELPLDADNFLLFKALYPITITDIECIVDPADTGESAVIDVQERNSTGDSPATVDATITCDNDGAADDGTLSNGAIAADGWVGIDIGTVTGTVTQLVVSVYYTVDAQ